MSACVYCNGFLHGAEERQQRVCDECREITTANPQLGPWVLKVVQGQVEKAVEEHMRHYDHERSGSIY